MAPAVLPPAPTATDPMAMIATKTAAVTPGPAKSGTAYARPLCARRYVHKHEAHGQRPRALVASRTRGGRQLRWHWFILLACVRVHSDSSQVRCAPDYSYGLTQLGRFHRPPRECNEMGIQAAGHMGDVFCSEATNKTTSANKLL